MSTYYREPHVDEAIQMHADKLYHHMLDQERLINAAKDQGLPEPTFAPVLQPQASGSVPKAGERAEIAPAIPFLDRDEIARLPNKPPLKPLPPGVDEDDVEDEYPHLPPMGAEMRRKIHPSKHEKWRKGLVGMTPLERELHEQSKLREINDATVTFNQYQDIQLDSFRKAHAGTSDRTAFGEWLVKNLGWEHPAAKKEKLDNFEKAQQAEKEAEQRRAKERERVKEWAKARAREIALEKGNGEGEQVKSKGWLW